MFDGHDADSTERNPFKLGRPVLGRVLGVVVLVALLAGACRSPLPSALHSQSPSPHTLASWSDCGGGFQCATLQVPLDYSNPQGRSISLALLRKQATDPSRRIGSLLLNPGGPGGSGNDFLRRDVALFTELNKRFDLVAWDPRGVGASTPVMCLTGPQMDAYLALDPVLDDAAEQNAWIQANRDFALGCKRNSGYLLPFMDSESTARDMDRIRDAIGDNKLTYLGFSYGTFIGQWYAHLFPTHVRALALDGVVDSQVHGSDAALTQLAGFEKNLDAYLSDCDSRPTCPFMHASDRRAWLTAIMTRLDATPLPVGHRQLTRGLAMTAVLATMYNQDRWSYLDQAVTAVGAGDGSKMLVLADSYNERNPDGTYSNIANGAFAATACIERTAATTQVFTKGLTEADVLRVAPFFGPWQEWQGLYCEFWPELPRPYEPLTVTGAPPILLIGATNDPATPYSEAQGVSQEIPNSVLLTRVGNGHTSYGFSSCIDIAENAYLIDLTLPPKGTVCSN